ncbi:TPA: hypothetical protein ACXDAY_002344 [Clostridium botulinum]|uniref:hypothetical protein n=1 Tax=Clostridium botulinum TaxID=1491 RepID=UPI000466F540|nr:hypothetical protein [Clostridium botulinum]APR02448.1 hypothetical protein RSJ2_4126 [Clostridium botulinum]AUN01631.1 hypothetical protein RSJ19_01245 [Clostridium botulinum]MBN3359353.1 hypothetical protein [Clostridium botulinum]MBN3367182.1 hypothetical protein [Clostridium botulinum]MBN3371815.1 hypothetical protein [Clostridium botulinum]
MEEKYLKRENETDYEYGLRLIEIKCEENPQDLDWQDLVSMLDLNIHKDSLRKACNTTEYSSYNVMKYFKNKQLHNIKDNEILKEIEEKKLELKKERMKLNTLRTITNRDLRETARIELYLEQLKEAVENIQPLYTPSNKEYNFNTIEDKVGLLGISDIHFGKIVEIKDLKGNIINKYDEDVFKKRMDRLFWEIRNIIIKEKLEKIVIYNLSDCIDGILRISQLKNLQYGIIDSVIKFSEFMAEWLSSLSNYVAIEYYQCWGNHDEIRLLTGKKGDFPEENVGRLIMEFLELRLKDNKNIVIHNENKPYIFSNILGMNVFGFHGECKDLNGALKDLQMIYKEDIDLLLAGHLHNNNLNTVGMGQFGDIQAIRIASLCGVDDYSMKLMKSASAGSNLFIIEKDKGKTITYDINLNINNIILKETLV